MREMILAFFAILLLVGCDASDMVESAGGKEDVALAKRVFDHIRIGDIESVRPMLGPDIASEADTIHERLAARISLREGGAPELYGYRRWTANGMETVIVSLQSVYPDDSVLLFTTQFKKDGGKTVIDTIQFNYYSSIDLQVHDFTLEDRSPVHYAFLALLAATALFILWTFILCLRTPISPIRKLVWCVVILVTVGQVNLDWTSGALSGTVASISLLRISFTQAPIGPWIFGWGFPLGAMLFHFRLRRAKKKVALAEASGVAITLEAAFGASDGDGGGDGGGGDGGGGGGD